MQKIKSFLIYTTPVCPHCTFLKQWLDEQDVSYEVIDVTVNPQKGQEMVQKTGQMGVPVSIITLDDAEATERIVLGFDKVQISSILGLNSNS